MTRDNFEIDYFTRRRLIMGCREFRQPFLRVDRNTDTVDGVILTPDQKSPANARRVVDSGHNNPSLVSSTSRDVLSRRYGDCVLPPAQRFAFTPAAGTRLWLIHHKNKKAPRLRGCFVLWCPEAGSNHRHADFQSNASPKFKHFQLVTK